LKQSTLDYGEMDADPRLDAWQQGQGRWAIAVNDQGHVAGIACTVCLDDQEANALLWLEVLPQYRRQGYGRALLAWAREQEPDALVIKSVGSAVGFYNHCGIPTAPIA
jgi:GNAT superfamily N-acetyltransferase